MRRMMERWRVLPGAARLCLVVWIALGLFGVAQLVPTALDRVRVSRLNGQQQRAASWAPVYGFAAASAPFIGEHKSILFIDPVQPAAESIALGVAADVDLADLTAFTYPLYPRPIHPIGHPPSDWQPGQASEEYIALWEQTTYRQPADIADAQSIQQVLAQAPSLTPVFSYTDLQGDKGFLYARRAAISQSPAGGAQGSAALVAPAQQPGTLTLADSALVLFGLATLCLIGFIVLVAFGLWNVNRGLVFALALPAGCIAVGLEMLIASLAGLRWSLPILGALWLVPAALAATRIAMASRARRYVTEARAGSHARPSATTSGRLALDELAAIVLLIVVCAGVTLVAPLGLPQSDGFGYYYFKAAAFFHDQGIVPYFAHARTLSATLPAHPPLVSLDVAWLYMLLGHINEHATLLLWPALFISAAAIMYQLARCVTTRRFALWLAVGFAVLSQLAGEAISPGFSDLPLATFALAGAGLLWLWLGLPESWTVLPMVAGFFLGGVALTKEEGSSLAIALVLAAAVTMLLSERRNTTGTLSRRFLALCGGMLLFGLVFAPWLFIRQFYSVPESLVSLQRLTPGTELQYLVVSAEGFAVRSIKYWAALLALAIAWLLRREHQSAGAMRAASLVVLSAVIIQSTLDIVAMTVSPYEIHVEVSLADGRVLTQLTPLLFVVCLVLWQELVHTSGASGAEESPVPLHVG